jgi:hypothetical protein
MIAGAIALGPTAARALVLTVALFVPIGTSVQAQDQGTDPATVIAAAQDARSGDDAAAAAGFFSDNAIWVRTVATGPCSRQSPCIGRPAILAQFQVEAAIHQCVAVVDQTVNGGVVVSHYEVRSDTLRRNGIERTLTVSMALVDQVKIVAKYTFSDLSDSQTAANAAIGAGTQAPGPPIPNPATRCG